LVVKRTLLSCADAWTRNQANERNADLNEAEAADAYA
jgi:hypothetical protein